MVEQKSNVIGPNSMLPITVGDFEKALSKAQAEVLAACINAICRYCADGDNPNGVGNHALFRDDNLVGQFYCAAWPLRKLQPAASALEELLREVQKEGRQQEQKEALHDVLAFNSGLGCTPQEGYRDLADALRDTQRLSIEKARASP